MHQGSSCSLLCCENNQYKTGVRDSSGPYVSHRNIVTLIKCQAAGQKVYNKLLHMAIAWVGWGAVMERPLMHVYVPCAGSSMPLEAQGCSPS